MSAQTSTKKFGLSDLISKLQKICKKCKEDQWPIDRVVFVVAAMRRVTATTKYAVSQLKQENGIWYSDRLYSEYTGAIVLLDGDSLFKLYGETDGFGRFFRPSMIAVSAKNSETGPSQVNKTSPNENKKGLVEKAKRVRPKKVASEQEKPAPKKKAPE